MKHEEYYRLWSYTKDVAEKLEEEGFPPGFYDDTVSDWLEDIERLIREGRKDIEKEIKGLDT